MRDEMTFEDAGKYLRTLFAKAGRPDGRYRTDEEQFDYLKANGKVKTITSIGDKWATLQTINFQNNSQPFYVLVNSDMELLNETTAYTPNASTYLDWLKSGLENFKNN